MANCTFDLIHRPPDLFSIFGFRAFALYVLGLGGGVREKEIDEKASYIIWSFKNLQETKFRSIYNIAAVGIR